MQKTHRRKPPQPVIAYRFNGQPFELGAALGEISAAAPAAETHWGFIPQGFPHRLREESRYAAREVGRSTGQTNTDAPAFFTRDGVRWDIGTWIVLEDGEVKLFSEDDFDKAFERVNPILGNVRDDR